MAKKCIVKRRGHEETFSERKLYKTIYSACVIAHIKKKDCTVIAKKALKDVKKAIGKKEAISSNQIFAMTIKALAKYDKDASFMYKTHRDLS
jgi:transcriptional regulator NrdR family protein